MNFTRRMLGVLALCLVAAGPACAGNVNARNFAIGFTNTQGHPDFGTLWSTLGVVADSNGTSGNGTDNADAINAINPIINPVVIGDCPAGGGIRIASRWFLKSDLTLYMKAGCRVYCDWVTTQTGPGCITQTDVTTALTNIILQGLYFKNISPTFKGKALRLFVDHFTLTNHTSDGFCAFAYVLGGDQEWQFSFINTPCGAGNAVNNAATDGLRQLGNFFPGHPKPATTPGRPANVWVYDSASIGTGDGALQVAPACQDSGPGNLPAASADDYLFERSYGSNGTFGVSVLIANGAQADVIAACDNTITNIRMDQITGAGALGAIKIQNALDPTGAIDGITFTNSSFDMSPQSSSAASSPLFVRGYDLSPIRNVLLQNITFANVYGLCADLSAAPTSNFVLDNVTCPVPRASGQPSVIVRSMTGLTIKNSSFGNRTGGGISMGPGPTSSSLLNRINGGNFTVTSPTILSNSITNMTNGDTGIRMQNVSGAIVNLNNIARRTGQTSSIGMSLMTASGVQPGTTGSTVTNNTMNTNTGIVCAPPAQGNTVNSNTGAADCP